MSTTQDQLSPTAKAVTQNKQTVSIRKVTVESLSPVIAKVQEHIAFLIEQTSNLRKQNSNLISAQANQKALEDQIVTINTTLQKLSSNINQFNRDKQNKLLSHSDELSEVNQRITKLQRELIFQEQRIEQINGKNESYLQQISQSKVQQTETIQSLKSSLDNYYEQELYKITSLNEQVQSLSKTIYFLEEKRVEDQQQIKNITNVITLFEMQREQLKKVVEKTTFLEHNVVMIDDYKDYKKYNRVQMQMTKKDIRGMIDDALTPEIRKFLPILIKKLDELSSFSNKLNQLYKALQSQKQEHSSMFHELKQEWQKKFIYFNTLNVESTKETKGLINDEISRLARSLEAKEENWSQKLKELEQDVNLNKKIGEINLADSLKKVEEDNVKYIHSWGEKFIEEKKAEIYLIVEEMKPKQEVNKQKQIFELVYSMQPLLIETKKQMKISHLQLQKAKSQLSEKLQLFSNQIVKFKTDVTRESMESKKMLQNFNKKLKNNDEYNHQISQLISKVIETTVILYGVSLNQQYLQLDKEVYVSFTDGILVETQEESNTIKYRRKNLNAELLKRAVLKEYAKLIDHIVLNQPLLKWDDRDLKPSFFFESILKSYKSLEEQHLQVQELPSKQIPTSQRVLIHQGNSTHYAMPQIPSKGKATINPDALSKTIDFERKQYQTVVLNTPRYSKEKEKEPNTHRKSIRLKKMEKKE